MVDVPLTLAPRLYCEAALTPGATASLPQRATRHVLALRLKVGDSVTLFNGDGYESSATITEIGKRGAVAAVRERRAVDRESPFEVRLAQGLCAGDKMDLVLQKATELGIAAIQPVVTTRSVVRLTNERQERREAHWQNVVIAACEQSGRNRIPPVAPTLGLTDFLSQAHGAGTRILLSPYGELTLRTLSPVVAPFTVLIGPEGGLAPQERDVAVAAGFVPVRFGPRVLRTETAPLAALAALQVLYGDC
jgi:16S rRNA (uracil1498-N3)-methyltransferase